MPIKGHPPSKELALVVRRVREAAGLSQGRFAEALGVSLVCIWRVETAERGISTVLLLRVGECARGEERAAIVAELRKRLGPGVCEFVRELVA